MNKKLKKKINEFIQNYGVTSDFQLLDIAKKLKIKINYIGFIEDLKDISQDGGYIINLGDDHGTHWTGFYKEKDKIFYFDSYAVPFEDKLIDLAKKANVSTIYYNDYYQLQGYTEELCGIWVLLFLYYFQNSKKTFEYRFKDFIKNYEDIDGNYSSGKTIGI